MQIIKDKQISTIDWIYVDNETEIGVEGNITVSLDRWKNHHQQCLNRTGKIGVRLTSTDNVNDLSDTLISLDLIELNFPGFGDGRIFSQARLLRTRLGYQGEIRATGHFLVDQIFYLMRVGVNAFQLENEQQLPLALSCMNDFSVTYQP